MKKIAELKRIVSAQDVGYSTEDTIPAYVPEKHFPITDKSRRLLHRAANCYNSFSEIRERRRRSRRYYRGDQWQDMVTVSINGEKKTMTEKEYIQSQGKPALKQNLIRPPVRNLIGQLRSQPYKSTVFARNSDNSLAAEMMTVALESALEMNDGKERDARLFQEFCISGFPIYEVSYKYDITRQRSIPKFRAVSVDRFIPDPDSSDVVGDDVSIVGELVDMSKDELISAYAKDTEQEMELRQMYASINPENTTKQAFSSDNTDSLSFYTPISSSQCRVIKVCVLEAEWMLDCHDYLDGTRTIVPISEQENIDAENEARVVMSQSTGISVPLIKVRKKYIQRWMYYHLSPHGHILFKMANPYEHKSHPYVFLPYPLVDGEVWGMVEDLIDQQRMVNRMNILLDFVISASSKGVLLVPEECIPDDMDIEDIAEEWTKYNGVIKIKTKQSVQLPQQIVASNFNIGITDMINRQVQWMQDISGVQNAQYGKSASSGTSAARYRQETANASLNAVDYLESFGSMLIKRDWKLMKIIKQYYTEKEYIALAGDEYSDEAHYYDPAVIKNLDFDNTIQKNQDTFTSRFIAEDSIMMLLQQGLINLRQYLSVSNTMYSKKLLKQLDELASQEQPSMEQMQGMIQDIQQQTPASNPTGLAASRALFNGSQGTM